MKTISILKNYDWPLERQLPSDNVLAGCKFVLDKVTQETDLVVVLNTTNIDIPKSIPIWCIMQEPPIMGMKEWHKGHPRAEKVFTTDVSLIDNRKYILTPGGLPWHINKTLDELVTKNPQVKTKGLSFIVSNASSMVGHKKRLKFLNEIKGKLDFDLFGKGHNYIKDKQDGLDEYKYSIAIENFSGKGHFTEKLTDCFLSFTIPIYYGCTNLGEYFPKNSFIEIDINNPLKTINNIKQKLDSGFYEKNLNSLKHARHLSLYEYSLFPFIANLVKCYG